MQDAQVTKSLTCTKKYIVSLFLEQNIKHFVGPDLGPNFLLL